jgi:hypothetical protein
MSALPGGNLPSVPGINSPPPVGRSNPDRQRREQGGKHRAPKKEDDQTAPHREADSAELTHHEEASAMPAPGAGPKGGANDERPHIDIQG